jgi:hypothetical protein
MPITNPLLRRGRIREVVPEIVPPDEAMPWPGTEDQNGTTSTVEASAEPASEHEAAGVE